MRALVRYEFPASILRRRRRREYVRKGFIIRAVGLFEKPVAHPDAANPEYGAVRAPQGQAEQEPGFAVPLEHDPVCPVIQAGQGEVGMFPRRFHHRTEKRLVLDVEFHFPLS